MKNLRDKILSDVRIELLDEFDRNFKRQGFFSENTWKPRKRPDKNRRQRAILIKSGRLRNSIGARINYARSEVVFTSSLPYAKVHNEGGKAGRGKGFSMPKRQFIGHHPVIDKKIVLIIREDIDEYLRNFNRTKIPRGD
jgi:phage gpG-like protein